MISGLFSIASTGLALYDAHEATGVFGWDSVAVSLGKLVLKMGYAIEHVDHDALDEMVTLAQSRVPVDTGRLKNGITGEVVDGVCEFRASAVHEDKAGGEDYARFVEFGTQAGTYGASQIVVADGGYYGGDVFMPARSARRRVAYRTHGGTEAQPYFYNSAHEVLARRDMDASNIIADSASSEGWDTQ